MKRWWLAVSVGCGGVGRPNEIACEDYVASFSCAGESGSHLLDCDAFEDEGPDCE